MAKDDGVGAPLTRAVGAEAQSRSSGPHCPAHGAEPLFPLAAPFVPQPFGPYAPLPPFIGTAGAAAAAAGAGGGGAGGACVMYIDRAGTLARGTGMLGISG